MTWKQLIGKIHEGLGESGACIRSVGHVLSVANNAGETFSNERITIMFSALVMAVSDLHSTIEHLTIGLDAVVETLSETDKSQEVKSE